MNTMRYELFRCPLKYLLKYYIRYFLLKVASGQPIGTVTGSECDNHIHLAMFKNGGTYIDPTKYIESLIPTVPTWKQICDDYKLVFMVDSLIHLEL